MPRYVFCLLVLLLAAGPSAARAQAAPAVPPSPDRAAVPQALPDADPEREPPTAHAASGAPRGTAELAVEVAWPKRREPRPLAPADVVVREGGEARRVVAVEPLAGTAPWRLVVYVDRALAGTATLRAAAGALAAQSRALAAMGPVEVVVAEPEPLVVLQATRQAAVLDEVLSTLALTGEGLEGPRPLRARFLERLRSAVPGEDPAELAAAALDDEERLVRRQADRLLAWLAANPPAGPTALLLVGDGFDLDPAAFYRGEVPGATLASGALERDARGLAQAVAALGWTALPLPMGEARLPRVQRFKLNPRPDGSGTVAVPLPRRRRRQAEPEEPEAPPPPPLLAPGEPLKLLAETTGGDVLASPAALAPALSRLAARLRVRYEAPPAAGGTARAVEVSAADPELALRARRWVAAGTPSEVAAARARRLLDGEEDEEGELEVSAALVRRDESAATRETGVAGTAGAPAAAGSASVETQASIGGAVGGERVRIEVRPAPGQDGSALRWTLAAAPGSAGVIQGVLVQAPAADAGGETSDRPGQGPGSPAAESGGGLPGIDRSGPTAGEESGGRGQGPSGPAVRQGGGPGAPAPAAGEEAPVPADSPDGEEGALWLAEVPLPAGAEQAAVLVDDPSGGPWGGALLAVEEPGERAGLDFAPPARTAAATTLLTGALTVRILRPAPGRASGPVAVEAEVEVPREGRLDRVEFFWNDELAATRRQAPFAARVTVPPGGRAGFLRVVARLEDGSFAEDAVPVNAGDLGERIDVRLAQVYVVVTDRDGRPVRGLGKDDFRIRRAGAPQPVAGLDEAGEQPITVGLAIDSSASMFLKLPRVQDAARSLLDVGLAGRDSALLVDYDTEPRLVRPATRDLDDVARALDVLRPDGGSNLMRAVVFSISQLAPVVGRKALVLYSDGVDEGEDISYREALKTARQAGVPVYLILTSPTAGRAEAKGIRSGALRSYAERLDRLTRATGGRLYAIGPSADVAAVYREILAELRSQYVVSFYPPPGAEGQDVQVELTRPGLTARTMRGILTRRSGTGR